MTVGGFFRAFWSQIVIAILSPFLVWGMVAIVLRCGYNTHTVPSGYVAKLLTPSGFAPEILQPGQVNIGSGSVSGKQTRLVLLEQTTRTVQEQFRDATVMPDHQDHRILTQDGVPTSVDMYVRVRLPDDTVVQNNIFLQVTPQSTADPLESTITLENIYTRFVELDVRNKVRDIISHRANFQDVLTHYSDVNAQVTAAVIKAFKDNNVPLKLEDAQLSQVLPDAQVWDSEVKKKSAEALAFQIESLGRAVRANPGYLEYLQWQALKDIAAVGSAKGTNTLIIVANGQPINAETWAAAQAVIDQNKKYGSPIPVPVPTDAATPAATPAPSKK